MSFKIASYLLIFTALAHLSGHYASKIPENDTESQLYNLLSNYRFNTPGGIQRTFMDVVNGFSLSYSMLSFFIGLVNLLILYHAANHIKLVKSVITANFIFWTLFQMITVFYTILPQIILYGLVWLFFLISFSQIKKLNT